MPIVEQDGKIYIQLNTGELWGDPLPKVFPDWQTAQREYAEGRVPTGIEGIIKEAKSVKASKT